MTAPVLVCPPAHLRVPAHVGSYGPEVSDLADSAGLTLDPEQRLVLDAMYAHDARGRLVATEVGVCAPRQNVKTHVGMASALGDLVLFDEPGCVWTAHLRTTSDKTFEQVRDLFLNWDHLRRLVDTVRDSDGEKSIRLRPPSAGATKPELTFLARSDRGGRGLTGRRVTLDEALFLTPGMLSALVPVLSAQSLTGSVQVRHLGSAGVASSAVWRDVRDRGRAGRGRLVWVEWAAPETACDAEGCTHEVGAAGCAWDRPDLIRAANLAVDRRIDLDYVLQTERPALGADFPRERLGWWDEPAGDDVPAIDVGRWAELADPDQVQPERVAAWGVAVAPDASWSAVCVGWLRGDGLRQVQLVDLRRGRAWVGDRVVELVARWGGVVSVNPAARGLVPDAEEPASGAQAQAHAALADAVVAGGLRHGNAPGLNIAVRDARWRLVGDVQLLDRKGSSDVSAADAAALALASTPLTASPPIEDTIW